MDCDTRLTIYGNDESESCAAHSLGSPQKSHYAWKDRIPIHAEEWKGNCGVRQNQQRRLNGFANRTNSDGFYGAAVELKGRRARWIASFEPHLPSAGDLIANVHPARPAAPFYASRSWVVTTGLFG